MWPGHLLNLEKRLVGRWIIPVCKRLSELCGFLWLRKVLRPGQNGTVGHPMLATVMATMRRRHRSSFQTSSALKFLFGLHHLPEKMPSMRPLGGRVLCLILRRSFESRGASQAEKVGLRSPGSDWTRSSHLAVIAALVPFTLWEPRVSKGLLGPLHLSLYLVNCTVDSKTDAQRGQVTCFELMVLSLVTELVCEPRSNSKPSWCPRPPCSLPGGGGFSLTLHLRTWSLRLLCDLEARWLMPLTRPGSWPDQAPESIRLMTCAGAICLYRGNSKWFFRKHTHTHTHTQISMNEYYSLWKDQHPKQENKTIK